MTAAGTAVLGTAIHDHRGIYRYRLTRSWNPNLASVGWVMLNPSTAGASTDDPTIRRVVRFSSSWGFGSATVVNLFALKATHPADLVASSAPVGPDNDESIEEVVSSTGVVIAAWGEHGWHANPATGVARCEEVLSLSAVRTRMILCLGLTRTGQPRHPLYLPSNTTAFAFRGHRKKLVAGVSDIV